MTSDLEDIVQILVNKIADEAYGRGRLFSEVEQERGKVGDAAHKARSATTANVALQAEIEKLRRQLPDATSKEGPF